MTKRSTVHDTFVIDRAFAFEREVVFAAWASAEAKSHWFVGPSTRILIDQLEQALRRQSSGARR